MDTWSPLQLAKMRAGGNSKCIEFFEQWGVSVKRSIKDKYHTKVAEVYRSKISTLAEVKLYNNSHLKCLYLFVNIFFLFFQNKGKTVSIASKYGRIIETTNDNTFIRRKQ